MPEPTTLQSPGGTEYPVSIPFLRALRKQRTSRLDQQEPTPMAEQREAVSNKSALGWIIGINSTLVVTGVVAIVSVLWSLNTALIKVGTTQENMVSRITALETSVTVGTQGRYTASDAVADRTAILATFNTTREAWSQSFRGLIDANTKLSTDVADLRVKLAELGHK